MGNLTIGLVNLPHMRELLQEHGVSVVTGDSFTESVTAIRNHVRTVSMDVVLLVGDSDHAPQQAGAWLRGMAARLPVVVVTLTGSTGLGEIQGLRAVLDTPTTWAQVLEAVTGSAEGAAAATIAVDGEVRIEAPAPTAPFPSPEDDPFGADEGDPWAVDFSIDDVAGAPPPNQDPAVTEHCPDEDDPWSSPEVTGNPPVPTPEPAYVGEPVPAPEADAPDTSPEADAEEDLEDFDFDFDDSPAEPVDDPPPVPALQPPEARTPRHAARIPHPIPAAVTDVEPVDVAGPADVPAPGPADHVTVDGAGAATAQLSSLEPRIDQATGDDFEEILSQAAIDRQRHPNRGHAGHERLGQVIICSARNGGVSKSTTSTVLAQYAGDHGPEGWKVALLDFNIGQGDVRGYLSLRRAPIPTVVDAARIEQAGDVLVSPTQLNSYRRGRPPLSFGLVAGTSSSITRAEAELLTPALLRDLVADLRKKADLVVIDTETIDEPDQTGYWDELFLPLVRDGAWLCMISTSSTESVNNVRDWLTHQQRAGTLTRDRVMLLFNRVPDGSIDAINTIAERMGNLGHHIGTMAEDEEVDYTQKSGEVPSEVDAYAPVAAAVLRHATGIGDFNPDAYTQPPGGFISRLFRRGGKK